MCREHAHWLCEGRECKRGRGILIDRVSAKKGKSKMTKEKMRKNSISERVSEKM